ncbi:putative death-receptor fusion protein-domain-containing protein [Elsinoe ampelina]|uniref:Putative death-receptor fusion protein-domain-containing protein n=1 Tax=Elsinoe ampelina TaxID=302913 RepID=A0A6A6G365_9PEZI|nr:putative death-receptor fusion protein-domain-containing protein [Elsinoe ampelina]
MDMTSKVAHLDEMPTLDMGDAGSTSGDSHTIGPRSRDLPVLSEKEIRAIAYGGAKLTSSHDDALEISELQRLLSQLLDTSDAPSITQSHRSAACNLLSSVIIQLNKDSNTGIQDLLWRAEGTWFRAYGVFLNRYGDSKPKPMKQLLGALMTTLQQATQSNAYLPARAWLLQDLSSIIKRSKQHPNPKPYIQAIIAGFEKQIFEPEELVRATGIVHAGTSTETKASQLNLFYARIFSLAALDDLGSSLASLITSGVTASSRNADPSSTSPSWLEPLIQAYSEDIVIQENYRHYVLPAIIGRNFKQLMIILNNMHFTEHWNIGNTQSNTKMDNGDTNESPLRVAGQYNRPTSDAIIVSCMLVGMSAGIVTLHESNSEIIVDETHGVVKIPTSVIEAMMQDPAKAYRSGALQMLTTESATMTPLSRSTLRILKQELPNMFAETDAGFRSDLFGMLQRLIDRLRTSSCALLKQKSTYLVVHRDFLLWLVRFSMFELRPSASYQRHICALRTMKILARSGIDPAVRDKYWSKGSHSQLSFIFKTELFGTPELSALTGLLLDPFDDVRGLAMSILQMLLDVEPGPQYEDSQTTQRTRLEGLLPNVERQAAQSGRADHADGVARLHGLVFSIVSSHASIPTTVDEPFSQQRMLQDTIARCQKILDSLRNDLSAALLSLPFHAVLISLRYMIEQAGLEDHGLETLSSFDHAIQDIAELTWQSVYPVLCNDAPEGYLPAEIEDGDLDVDTKDVLSFAWRALKEASLLQRSYVISMTKHKPARLPATSITSHISLCFTELRELRHRGAFSTVAQTFALCCSQLTECFPDEAGTIVKLYDQTISTITSTTTINTRRSAGLPAMLAGLLTSASPESGLFKRAVHELSSIASDANLPSELDYQSLPQVHALNCLREIFKHSKLGQRSEPYLSDALALSGSCLTSDLWGIRNSGLMLFRALLDRLLGTNDDYSEVGTTSSSKEIFVRHPQMLPLLYRLLDADVYDLTETAAVEKVFPALQLLQRAAPPDSEITNIRSSISKLIGCPHWLVRDKAARTLATTYRNDNIFDALRDITCDKVTTSNARHGTLLLMKYSLRYLDVGVTRNIDAAAAVLAEVFKRDKLDDQPDYVQATALDIVSEFATRINRPTIVDALLELLQDLRPTMSIIEQREAGHLQPIRLSAMSLKSDSALVHHHAATRLCVDVLARDVSQADVNACVSLLETCTSFVLSPSCTDNDLGRMFMAGWELLKTASSTDDLVRVAAMDLSIGCSMHDGFAAAVDIDIVCAEWSDMALRCRSSPIAHDRVLVLSAALADLELREGQAVGSDKVQRLTSILFMTKLAAHEDQPYDTRFAVATALSKLVASLDIMKQEPIYANSLVDLAILTYDLTNDDDDDIRGIAAEIASKVLNLTHKRPSAKISLAAGSQLLTRLVRHFSGNGHLASVATARLMTFRSGDETLTPVSGLLSEYLRGDSALFAEEKQNLYIDPAREARVWSGFAMKFSPSSIQTAQVESLRRWTSEGIEALINASSVHKGGPLGWSYKPDTFALGLQVIFNAQVLLHWQRQRRGLRLQSATLRQQLLQFLQVGRKQDLHPIWLDQLEKALTADLLAGVQRAGRLLNCVTPHDT